LKRKVEKETSDVIGIRARTKRQLYFHFFSSRKFRLLILLPFTPATRETSSSSVNSTKKVLTHCPQSLFAVHDRRRTLLALELGLAERERDVPIPDHVLKK
jgi:hypothetical protein